MTRQAEDLLQDALTLPDEERAEIAGALLESLERTVEVDVETAWRKEVAVRVAALDAGEIETVPWDEVRDQLLARVSEKQRRD